MARGIARRGRVEHDARLTWIGIDSQKQEFSGENAEVDNAIPDRLWRLVGVERLKSSGLSSRRGIRQKREVDRFVDRALNRLKGDYTALHDTCRDPSGHPQSIGTLPRQVETGLQPRQRREPSHLGDRIAGAFIGDKIDAPASL